MTIDLAALQSSYRAAPGLDASTHVGIASTTTDPGDAATAAQAVQGMGESTMTVSTLRQLNAADQAKFWNNADDNTRSMWQGAGYGGPPQHHRSLFGTVTHAVFHGEFSPIAGLAGAAGDVMNAVAAGGRATQHAYRTVEAIGKGVTNVDQNGQVSTLAGITPPDQQNSFVNLRQGIGMKLLSPNAYSKAWQATNKGEKTFLTAQYNKTQQSYQGQSLNIGGKTLPLFDVARAISSGELNDYAKQQFGDDANSLGDLDHEVNANPAVKAAVKDLNDSKISFGRVITPDSLWHTHPALATGLSGAGDAVFDIKTDPTLYAGKARKAVQAVRWGVRSNEDLQAAVTSGAGDRWVKEVTDRLARTDENGAANPDYAAVLNRFPSLSAALPDLARKGINTPDQLVQAMKLPTGSDATVENVGQWLKDNYTAARILVGDGSAAGKDAVMAPHLSYAASKLLDVKDWANNTIDWSKNVSLPNVLGGPVTSKPLNLLGSSFKKMTNLIPEGKDFDPNGADAVTFVQRFANTYLDKGAADNVVNAWVGAGYDTAAKRNVYMDMLGKVFEKAGMSNTAEGQRLMARHITDTEDAMLRQSYAPGGISNVVQDGGTTTHGIFSHQLSSEWSLPSYKALAAASQKGTIGQMAYGVSNNTVANLFNTIWKPAQLLRFGFPVRVAADELFGGMLRNGVLGTVQARLAKPVGRALTDYASELDPTHTELAKQDGNALGVLAANLAQRTRNGMQKVYAGSSAIAQQVTPQDTHDAIKWGIDNGTLGQSFKDEISAAAHGTHLGNDPDNAMKLLKDGSAPQTIYFKPSGDYRDYEPGNDFYNRIWKWNLRNIASDPEARVILENYNMPETDLVRHVADYMQSPEWRSNWVRGARSRQLSDGRLVGQDGVTEDDAALDWASKAKAAVDALVRGEDGTVHQPLIDHLLEHRESPGLDVLDSIKGKARPETLSGPEQVPTRMGGVTNYLKEFSDWGFSRIGKTIDWMAREPLYLHNFAAAKKTLTPIIESSLGKGEASEQVLKELVSARAVRNTAPFIHNPAIRSQMNVLTQNILPFQFAQEQFWKRWGRTLAHSPEAIRKAQLGVNALSTTGITHDDGTGNQVFSYPMTGHGQKWVAAALNAVGSNVLVPVNGGFSGQLKMVAPGFDTSREFMPSFGPLVTLPMTQVLKHFPELQPAETAILGDIAVSRSAWEQILPASVSRFVHLAIDKPQTSTQYASSMMKATQDIIASKYDPKNPQSLDEWLQQLQSDPTGKTQQDFLDQIKNGTRINMAARALLGFMAPAAPQMDIGTTQFGKRMKELQGMGLDFTHAQQQILRDDPSLTPYATYQSAGAGSEPLPNTKESLAALEKHGAFFQDHRTAGGFFLPAPASTDPFSAEAYRLEMTYQMRKRRTPEELLNQIVYNEAAGTYFDVRDDYMKAVKNQHGAAKQANDQTWQQWADGYKQAHPQFASMLMDHNAADKRLRTFRDLQNAFNDTRAPQNPQTTAMKTLTDTYADYLSAVDRLKGQNSGAADRLRKQWKATMVDFAHGYTRDNALANNVYNSLIRPDLEGSE